MVLVTSSSLERQKKLRTRQLGARLVIAALVLFWTLLWHSSTWTTRLSSHQTQSPNDRERIGMKALYIVTSSKEYNTGEKETKTGQDRFMEIMMPVVLEGVETMVPDYEVDVYLILGYTLSRERHQLLQDRLPAGVGLQVWNDATPLNYEYMDKKARAAWIDEMPMSLARQHRYVVKDKLPYYDFFMAFEDDMLVTKSHVEYYLSFLEEIESYTPLDEKQNQSASTTSSRRDEWWGGLTQDEIRRIRPGFIRNEVLTSSQHLTQEVDSPIRPNLRQLADVVDPKPCCHHSKYVGFQGKLAPTNPSADQLMIWETAIEGLSVRRLPDNHRWVALLPILGAPSLVGGYWSGTNGALLPAFKKKPRSDRNEYMGQSAGWMASRREVLEFHTSLCTSSFLPPFDLPNYHDDGMGFRTESVEYWSGGLQLFGQMCGIQRILSLEPLEFSRHLIYHTANNKQKEIARSRLVLVSTLMGQLQQVQQKAQAAMIRKLRQRYIFYPLLRSFGFAD